MKKIKKFLNSYIYFVISILLVIAAALVIGKLVFDKHMTEQTQDVLKEEFFKAVETNQQSFDITDNKNESVNVDETLISEDDNYNVSLSDYESIELLQEDEITEEAIVQKEETLQDVISRTGLTVLAYIEIPKLNVEYVVVEGIDNVALSRTIGHFNETALPGQIGNFALAGHRGGRYGAFFKKVNELVGGDDIVVTDLSGTQYIYKVTDLYVVEATDVSVLEYTDDATITLVTCEDNGKRRLIVKGKLSQ